MRPLTRILRKFALASIGVTLMFGVTVFQPAGSLAGFGTSPGSPRLVTHCAHGQHFPEANL